MAYMLHIASLLKCLDLMIIYGGYVKVALVSERYILKYLGVNVSKYLML